MYDHNLIAVYESRATAEQARDRLMQIGIPASDIRLSAEGAPETIGRAEGATDLERRGGGFWDWLFGYDVPERDRTWYDAQLREGRSAVSVRVRDDVERDRVTEVLEEFDPIDFEHEGSMATSTTEAAVIGRPGPMVDRDIAAREPGFVAPDETISATTARRASTEGEQVIPVVKEELDVGKRARERRYRIRTYVVERPVETPVHLRDEKVIIEHRPVSGDRVVGEGEFPKEREVELVERHEEPVVTKHRTGEDVVVRKEAEERTETVRDTVRETRVDVDRNAKVDRDRTMDLEKDRVEREGTLPHRNT